MVVSPQYSYIRFRRNGINYAFCVTSNGNYNPDVAARMQCRRGGVTYEIYLVPTNDPFASPVRIYRNGAERAIRYCTSHSNTPKHDNWAAHTNIPTHDNHAAPGHTNSLNYTNHSHGNHSDTPAYTNHSHPNHSDTPAYNDTSIRYIEISFQNGDAEWYYTDNSQSHFDSTAFPIAHINIWGVGQYEYFNHSNWSGYHSVVDYTDWVDYGEYVDAYSWVFDTHKDIDNPPDFSNTSHSNTNETIPHSDSGSFLAHYDIGHVNNVFTNSGYVDTPHSNSESILTF
jgi:hypothetical protein